jgi:hypothetical protein
VVRLDGKDELSEQKPRRLPAPRSIAEIPGGHAVVDAGGRRLAYVYRNASLDAGVNSEALTDDEARRVAANIAKNAPSYRATSGALTVSRQRGYGSP